MTNRYPVAALAAALLAAPVVAQTATPLTATPLTLAAWSGRIGHELDKRLQYPSPMLGHTPGSGVVRVKFNCSESGRPDKVTVLKTSGDPALDRAAARAVSRIATLHPLPDGIGHDQRYVATILFARDYDDYVAQEKSLRAEAIKGNAWFKGPASIALADPDTDRVG